MIWVTTAFAAPVAIEGTDVVVDVREQDRFVPAHDVASDMLLPDVVGVYVPVGAAPLTSVPVSWFPGGWLDPAVPVDADALLAELRTREPTLRSWVEPPAWDPRHGTFSWALDTSAGGGSVSGYVARPGRSGVVVVESTVASQWPEARAGLRDVAGTLAFAPGAAHADVGAEEPRFADGLGGLVLAVVAPEPAPGWLSSRHPRRLLLFGLSLFLIPVVIEWGRRRGTSWGRRLDPEHVPDVD